MPKSSKQFTVLITGANGYTANHMVRCIDAISPRPVILGLQRISTSKPRSNIYLFDQVYNRIDDLKSDHPSVDVVFHLAAYIPKSQEKDDINRLFESNIELTEKLIFSFQEAHFIFASSIAVYGRQEGPVSVNSAFNSPSLYGHSKIAAEFLIQTSSHWSIIRLTSILGRDMPKTSFVPIIQEQAQKNGVIKIVGNGERRQNYIDVRDVVRLFAHIMSLPKENSNKLILIGGGVRSIKNIKIAELTAELTGARIEKSGIDNSPSFVAIDMSLPKTYEHFFTINQTLEWMQ